MARFSRSASAEPIPTAHSCRSLSKAITAIAVALLIQDGKLMLDSTLDDLLGPMFAGRGHPLDPSLHDITIEELRVTPPASEPAALSIPSMDFEAARSSPL